MKNSNDINRIENVTRLEVIDPLGRLLVLKNVTINLSFQDADKTLKIFVAEKTPERADNATKTIAKLLLATPINETGRNTELYEMLLERTGRKHISCAELFEMTK